ncbi:MBL fold metallo-hydrolase [Algisphaera agarilytica]|uniref:Glyoxylase-like metal-dependent hydrolase (Beta-lactamase superfamily II) n=1 Tax=Algisphaera agarilytica TaxID=1385975 RepID=A0A7X0LL95_9BACT|nr:MBL fold metallo-hydrolase [Algisphaera agarilytica]MBB6430664.1 glyoxylase-like metal-dependent hydrolase (beta-lactamase superfamily II) [Algisphaera agarilytica]
MQVASGIHQFQTGDFNWYVVEAHGRLTVVDCGWPRHYRALLDGLEAMGRSVADVEAILLTHAHADHTGFAERLRKEAQAPVWVHEDDHGMALRRGQLPWFALVSRSWHPHLFGMLLHGALNGVFNLPRITEAKTFADGQTLDVPGRPVVIHTPGHTPGQVSFHFPDRNTLICGDTLVTLELLSGKAVTPQLAYEALNANGETSRRSLDKLRHLGEITLLPGHGKPWTGHLAEALAEV